MVEYLGFANHLPHAAEIGEQRVLIVDDRPNEGLEIGQNVKRLGHEVLFSYSIPDYENRIDFCEPTAILFDNDMSKSHTNNLQKLISRVEGYRALKHLNCLQTLGHYQHIKRVIFHSSFLNPGYETRGPISRAIMWNMCRVIRNMNGSVKGVHYAAQPKGLLMDNPRVEGSKVFLI